MWRKAPGALAHTPAVLAALVGAAAILGLAAASGPLFVASAATAARAAEVAALDPGEAGVVVEVPVGPATDAFAALDHRLAEEVAGALPELESAISTARTVPVTMSAGGGELRVRLVGTAEAPVGGFIVPEAVAGELAVGAGDSFTLRRAGRTVSVQAEQVRDDGLAGEFAEVVADVDMVLTAAAQLAAPVDVRWVFPLESPPAEGIDDLAARIQALRQRIDDPGTDVGAVVAEQAEFRTRVQTDSALPGAARRTAQAARALEPAVRSLWVAAVLAAFVVVAGAGVLRARRRRLEHTVMAVRGVSPLAQALRAGVEALLPVFAGAAVGVAAATGVVGALGPGGLVPGALARAALAAAGAALVAVGLTAASTGLAARGRYAVTSRTRHALGLIPWEIAPLALAAVAYAGMRAPVPDTAAGIDPLLLAFPILALLGASGLTARILAAALPRLRTVGCEAPAATLLLVRRIAAVPGASVSLVAVTGLAVGVLVAAATLAASAAETADAKAAVALGAAAAAAAPALVPADAVPGTTVVGRAEGRVEPGGARVDLLAVDAVAFAGVAAWRPAFADRPLDDLLLRLNPDGRDQSVPVLVVGGLPAEPLRLHGPGFVIPITATATADAFPGLGSDRPLVVADRDVLAAAVAVADGRPLPIALGAEVWAAGDVELAAARAVQAGADPDGVRTSADLADTAPLRAARWTFGYLQGVAAAAGLLAAFAVALVLTERQRAREVGYALARRMGLTRGAHLRGVAGELGALLATAVALGMALGLGVAALAVPAADPLPGQPPAPLLAVPWPALASVVVGAAVVAGVGAALVQRAADRTRLAEVLRVPD